MAPKKNTTINDLAVMVQQGFQEAARQLDLTAKQEDMHQRFNVVEERLDRIERIVLGEHKHRIEQLEAEVKNIKDAFAIK